MAWRENRLCALPPVSVAAAPGVVERAGIVTKEELAQAMETLAVLQVRPQHHPLPLLVVCRACEWDRVHGRWSGVQGGDAFGDHMEDCYYLTLQKCAAALDSAAAASVAEDS